MLVNRNTCEMILRRVESTEMDAHRIPEYIYDSKAAFGIMGDPLISMIYDFMGWETEKTYAAEGIATRDGVLFSMVDAKIIDGWERRVMTEESIK